jgi:hypothetical protein
MKRVRVLFFVMAILAAQALHGVVPQKWEIRSNDEFLKGKLDGISVSYEGVLLLRNFIYPISSPRREKYSWGRGMPGRYIKSEKAEPRSYISRCLKWIFTA